MGIPDYDGLFDALDTSLCGYLTIDQLQEFQVEVYFSPLDVRQIAASIHTVCGSENAATICPKEYFGGVVEEMGRRVLLEESIHWDFQCLDVLGSGRISLNSALLLFKCVHGDSFSLQTWNNFVSSRSKKLSDVSFDEIKLWLCDLPTGGPCDDTEFLRERDELELHENEKLYNEWDELEKLQEDTRAIAEREVTRNNEALRMKQKSEHRIRRVEKEGIDAILYDVESETEDDDVRRKRQTVGASDLLAILKNKYEVLRDQLLLGQIQHEMGEGMWSALSPSEQEEKLVHSRMKEQGLSSGEGFVSNSATASGLKYQKTLLALLGHGRLSMEQVLNEENKRRSKLEDEGKSDAEIHTILQTEWQERLKGDKDSDAMLSDLCHRYQGEKELLKMNIRGSSGSAVMTASQRLQEFKLLYREYLKASLELNFESACLVVGVAETFVNCNEVDRFNFGKLLQVQLAERLLYEKRGYKLRTEFNQPELTCHDPDGGVVEYYEDLIKALERKHRAEVEMMVHMMQSSESGHSRAEVKKMSSEERENQFVVIKTQRQGWRSRSSQEKMETKSSHFRLLQEAISIVFVNKRLETSGNPGGDAVIASSLLAKLLQQQEIDARNVLAEKDQNPDELQSMRDEQEQMYKEGWLENLSAVILGTSDITRLEDDIIKLLEAKYDLIRHKVLEDALRDQKGTEEWENTPVVERYNLVTKAKTNEKKFRVQKRFSGAIKMLGEGFMSSEKFLSLLGENRQAFLNKLSSVLEKRRNRSSEGLEPENANHGIEERNLQSSGNLWQDLDERYRDEKQIIVRRLQEGGSGNREVHDTMMRLQQQKRLSEKEPNMLCAVLVLGLTERHRRVASERLTEDRNRRELLAKEHLVLARLKGKDEEKEIEDGEPNKDEQREWVDAVLREMERKHRMERTFLSSLMLDNAALEDVKTEAREMSEDERHKRLMELKDEREALDLDEKGDQDMNLTILEMACGFKIESRRFRLEHGTKENRVNDDVIFVSLLVNLHERQNDECEEMLEEIVEKSKEELAQIRTRHITSFKCEYLENVASVLMTYDGLGSNDEILAALENKYDALRDKLLLEALRKQLGEDEWKRLSEKERQLRLMKLKLEAKRLRREDKLDELAKLLGEGFAADVSLRKLLGENRDKYEQQLRERLARRRERLAQGLPEEESDNEETGDELAKDADILKDLERRFEDERDALMAKLLGANNQFLSERERQALLARLKREQLKARLEEKFDSAALVLGLAERQRKDAEERLMSDRARHEQLARQRLEERRNRKNRKFLSEKDIVSEGDHGVLQEAVLRMLENKHCQEREVLVALLEHEENSLYDLAESMTLNQREEHIGSLKVKKNDLDKDDKEAHRQILQEAAIMKFVSRQKNLELTNADDTVTKETVVVSLLADLQQEQDKESEVLIALLPDKDKDELVGLQTRLLSEAQSTEVRSNLMTVFGTAEQVTNVGEEQLLDALDAKYDTLRDKLLTEALMKQMSEAEWQALSEQERQARLVKMKLEEKRLRKEGKLDELQALLGAAFDAEANLTELMGQNKARYKERMREKLEKRRQRLKEGMTKEEVAKLEAQEDVQFEEELKKEANVNPLINLMQCYDKEKEALLAALRDNDARFSSERHRQAELARMRREERKARHEDKYDTAALVLGLAQAQKTTLEELQKKDRLRQEQLARERLAARRRKKSSELRNDLKEKEQEGMEEVSDKENFVTLQEAVLKELEKKQECEREFLQQLLHEERKSELRKNTQKLKSKKRSERLTELKELREQWRDSGADGTPDSEKEHTNILREAVCLKMISTLEELQTAGGAGVKEEDGHVVLLANLQQIQDQEAEILLRDLATKSSVTLTQLRAVQCQARRYRWYDNIAGSLLGMTSQHDVTGGPDGVPGEKELLSALEEKYDALKDKLIAESLMNELGVAEWEKMTERERQTRIMKLRLKEKKLRKEGKIDEANRLFGESLEHASSLSKLMGESKAEQKEALRRRLQKLRDLKAAGIEMTTEEAQLLEDGIEDVLEEEVSTEDLMSDLQARYEEEKKALLASLSGQDKRFSSERQRQLELARLRREQKKIAKEDKFDAAALVLGLAKQQETAREASYRKDRSRHEQLARERLAALKAKRAEKEAVLVLTSEEEQRAVLEKKLQEEEENEQNLLTQEALEIAKGGIVAVQEAILREIEKKHGVEIKMLSDLLDVSESDAEAVAASSYLNNKRRSEKMTELFNDYKNWKNATVEETRKTSRTDITMTEEEKQQHIMRTAENQMKLMKILKAGIVLRVMNLKEELLAQEVNESEVKEELSVTLVADLQEKQTTESRAVENILAEKDEATLNHVKDDQRLIRQECIVDNLAAVVLQQEQEKSEEESNEMAQMEEEQTKQLADMEQELAEEKKRKMMSGASEGEITAALEEIRRQQEAKKKAMNDALQRQRNLAKAKLEARRRKRDDKQYEEDIAASLLMMAERESSLVREKTMIQRTRQGESLQERLSRRRDERARRKAQEEQERDAKEKGESEGVIAGEDVEETTGDQGTTERFVEKTVKLKDTSTRPSLPAGFAMKREKTVVDVEVSEDKKKEIVGSLLREHTTFGMGVERERRRQEDAMRERRFRKKSTVAQAAATIVGLGERQKTMVQQKQKEERDRQLTMVRDRISRVRHERTMTMREPRKDSVGFENILTQEEAEGLDAEDRMKLIATKMEEKFKVEQRKTSISMQEPGFGMDNGLADIEKKESVRLDEKGKERKLKDRLAARKRAKKEGRVGNQEDTGDDVAMEGDNPE